MEDSIFKLLNESVTIGFLNRQCPTPRPDVTITPVNFSRIDEVKPTQKKEVVEIVSSPDSSFEPFPPTFGSCIRGLFQGRVRTNRMEDFLINHRQRRF